MLYVAQSARDTSCAAGANACDGLRNVRYGPNRALREPRRSRRGVAARARLTVWGHGPAESLGTMDQVKFRELIRLLEDDGWQLVAQRGSHQQYEHPSKPGKVTVAGKPGADVPKGTAANILRQAGLRRPNR